MSDENVGTEPAGRRSAAGADLVIPLLAAAFTIYFLADTWGFTWEAKANGVVIGTLLLVLIAIQLARIGLDVAAGRATLGLGALVEPSTAQFQRLGLIAILTVWVATIAWLGTTLSLILVMAASMWVLGVRDGKTLSIASIGTATAVYIVFIFLLQSRLPRGVVENGISALTGGSL